MSVDSPPLSATLPLAPPEVVPDLSTYVTEDDTPVDSVFHAYQQMLLVDQLISSWPGPGGGRPFFVTKNVGLFHTAKQPPVVPDVMLAVDVDFGVDYALPENRSYFQWVVGKPPDVVIEVVSQTPNGEDSTKLQLYARIGVPIYVIFDPAHYLIPDDLRVYVRDGMTNYRRVPSGTITEFGLGLKTWDGVYANEAVRWLRWTDANGTLIPTGQERAEAEKDRADTEKERADTEKERADTEKERADLAEARAKAMEEKLARYEAKLKNAELSLNGD